MCYVQLLTLGVGRLEQGKEEVKEREVWTEGQGGLGKGCWLSGAIRE